MPSFHLFQEGPHQKLFFELKYKNNKRAKMKGGLGWMKNIGKDPARFSMGTIFLVLSTFHIHMKLMIFTV